MAHKTKIMYIESKAESLNGPARIGRVIYSKTGTTAYYQGKTFQKTTQAFKANFFETESGDEYWISGPRRDGSDRLYASNIPVEIDDDVREEYWLTIRNRPDLVGRKHT
jgi:hypothetical protein